MAQLAGSSRGANLTMKRGLASAQGEGGPPRRSLPDRCPGGCLRRARRRLGSLRNTFPFQPGQSGALLSLDGRVCLDYVSQPQAFARLYPKLLEGYLLDAMESLDGKAAGDPEAFLTAIAEAPRSRGDSTGLGEDVRLRGESIVGSGLELDGELLQLCAFSSERTSNADRTPKPSAVVTNGGRRAD